MSRELIYLILFRQHNNDDYIFTVFETTRVARQKAFCKSRYYFTMTEVKTICNHVKVLHNYLKMSIFRGMHLCDCFVEKAQLWIPDSEEKIKCLLENMPGWYHTKFNAMHELKINLQKT
jgi:hypothetical protein